jgi:hypothetical protein
MQAGDLAAVIVAVVSLAATAVVTVAALSLLRTMRELRAVLDTLRRETEPLVADLRLTVDKAEADLQRVEGILDSAERITTTVDTASQLTYRALSPPLIKTMSVMAGVRRAGRRLRGRTDRELVEATLVETLPEPESRRRGRRSRRDRRAIDPTTRRTERRR